MQHISCCPRPHLPFQSLFKAFGIYDSWTSEIWKSVEPLLSRQPRECGVRRLRYPFSRTDMCACLINMWNTEKIRSGLKNLIDVCQLTNSLSSSIMNCTLFPPWLMPGMMDSISNEDLMALTDWFWHVLFPHCRFWAKSGSSDADLVERQPKMYSRIWWIKHEEHLISLGL